MNDIPMITPEKIITTIKNKKTGEIKTLTYDGKYIRTPQPK